MKMGTLKFACIYILSSAFSTNVISQTCIIGAVNGSKIYIGADSREKRLIITGNKRETSYASVCKIHREGQFYYGIAYNFGIYTIRTALNYSCKNNNTYKKAYNFFKKEVNQPLVDSLALIKTFNRGFYNELTRSPLFGVVIADFENNKPVLHYIEAATQLNIFGVVELIIMDTLISRCVAGHDEAINSMVFSESTWKNRRTPSVIKELVKIQAKNTPESVAEPIDILEISEKGSKWVVSKRGCSLDY